MNSFTTRIMAFFDGGSSSENIPLSAYVEGMHRLTGGKVDCLHPGIELACYLSKENAQRVNK
jgi:hypothetical protein